MWDEKHVDLGWSLMTREMLDVSSYVLSLDAVRRIVSLHIEEACERSSV